MFRSLFSVTGARRGASNLSRTFRPGCCLCRREERGHAAIAASPLAEAGLCPGRRHRDLCRLDKCDLAYDHQMKYRRARDQLLVFAAWPGLVDSNEQRVRTSPQARRHSAQGHKRLPCHVGCKWPGRLANRRRHRPSAHRCSLTAPQDRKRGWTITNLEAMVVASFHRTIICRHTIAHCKSHYALFHCANDVVRRKG